MDCSRPRGDERLMPLVHTGHESGHQPRDPRPAECPARRSRNKTSCPPRSEQQETEREISDEVARLAHVKMPDFEPGMAYSGQVMKDAIEQAAGVGGGKHGRRLDGDQSHPNERGEPSFEDFRALGSQAPESSEQKNGLISTSTVSICMILNHSTA